LAVVLPLPAYAQSTDTDASAVAAAASSANFVRWTGSLPQAAGRTVELSFSIYQNPAGGPALWSETQSVKVGADGRYSVLLGATSAEGIPQTLFQAGEARWIEAKPLTLQLNATFSGDVVLETGKAKASARSLLAAVPYALKSADAETLAGRPASDYLTREDLQSTAVGQVKAISDTTSTLSNPTSSLPIVGTPLPILGSSPSSSGSSSAGGTSLNGVGTSGFLPAWTASATLGNSMIAQSGTNVGIGTSAPATMLDVNGASTLRGTVGLLATAATLAAGVNSPALQLGASAYSSSNNTAVPQNFVWQAQSAGNNTPTPSANLHLLFAAGDATPAATGLSIDPNGVISFVPSQTFPGVGASAITGITTGPGLTGGGSSGNVIVALSGPISTANGGTGATSPADALANLGGISSTQTTPQTIAGALTGTNINVKFLNGIPQADQFNGADFCVKLRAANVWALANGYSMVDATHFPSTVTCSVDPVTTLNGGYGCTAVLTDELPASRILSSVPWTINNSNFKLVGKGPGQTILSYTGSSVVPAVLTIGGSATNSYYANNDVVSGMSIIGGLTANAKDGILTQAAGVYKLEDVSIWGVTGCGIHTQNAVTSTFIRPHIWADEASRSGYLTGYQIPASGLCFDQTTSGATTTDGTVVDPVVTSVSGPGFNLMAAQGMTFTSGTSEGNGSGIKIGANAIFNTFINTDLEANHANIDGVDINDSGSGNRFVNVLALSACSSCNSVVMNGTYLTSHFVGGRAASGIGGSNYAASEGGSSSGPNSFTPSLTVNYDGSASAFPFRIFTPNITSYDQVGMLIGPDRYGATAYDDANLNLLYYGPGNTGNKLRLGMIGGPLMTIDGVGNVVAPGSFTSAAFTSSAAAGTAPLTVTSTTPVANLTLSSTSQVVGLDQKLRGLAPAASPAFNGLATFTGGTSSAAYGTLTICSSTASPAICGSATAGRVQIAASATSLVINSSAFTANTGCWFTYDISGITAPTNMTSLLPPYISAKMAGNSITINVPVAPLSNPVNVQFGCEN
jgi:hypothetical protein